eukprot:m.77491 g.77491  ORF g.77491 m.77491 type:complete len:223 (+) comp12628_c0_seq3:15-683(+)
MAVEAALHLFVILTLSLVSISTACTTMEELEKNMPQWVGKVPYSHLVNKTWGYPTDCSGFVSWALQTDVGYFLKAYEYGSSMYAQRIPTDELRYGDIVVHVWAPEWAENRCHKKATKESAESEIDMEDFDYLPGHVYFFDKWVDGNKTEFWAYESSQTENQTDACLQDGPRFCFNHHVKKERKQADKWSSDNCTSSKYRFVTGGPHRLSPSLLCSTPQVNNS